MARGVLAMWRNCQLKDVGSRCESGEIIVNQWTNYRPPMLHEIPIFA